MILSMTGYGKGVAANGGLSAEVEVKSVNSRYLDISLKLPSSLLNKEYDVREFIKTKITRGKLSVIIQLKKIEDETEIVPIDKDKLKSYIQLIKEIKKTAKLSEKIKLDHLLLNRDLFTSGNNVEYSEAEFQLIKKALGAALDQLKKMKKNEGLELAKDLKKRILMIENRLNEIEADYKKAIPEQFEKLKGRVKSMIENITEFSDRLELELAVIADRSEITEECVRLRSHLKFFLESIDKDDDPGRKLNFICQEMNRETNTIASKSISTPVTHNSVLIKEEIEKIREQIQNIE
ncbi:MAG: YicC family protein [Ignavibacteria bacterium CG_4_9_14_3_um_filter_36_18]|nr:MAG: YicC family protein [Ignavibacteria bacterium CG_4_9_14_3_um_filter_36_18]